MEKLFSTFLTVQHNVTLKHYLDVLSSMDVLERPNVAKLCHSACNSAIESRRFGKNPIPKAVVYIANL